jgi:hypothetical protein
VPDWRSLASLFGIICHIAFTWRAWGDVSGHLERFFSRLKTDTAYAAVEGVKTQKKKSNHVCFAYNVKTGCNKSDTCQYKHKCTEDDVQRSIQNMSMRGFRRTLLESFMYHGPVDSHYL